jgi:hypothetical protein
MPVARRSAEARCGELERFFVKEDPTFLFCGLRRVCKDGSSCWTSEENAKAMQAEQDDEKPVTFEDMLKAVAGSSGSPATSPPSTPSKTTEKVETLSSAESLGSALDAVTPTTAAPLSITLFPPQPPKISFPEQLEENGPATKGGIVQKKCNDLPARETLNRISRYFEQLVDITAILSGSSDIWLRRPVGCTATRTTRRTTERTRST